MEITEDMMTETERPLRIVELNVQDIKRIEAVAIRPGGKHTVLLGGDNAQGKSSVLDAIMMALGGKSMMCSEPVRRGAKQGDIAVDLGDLVVRRIVKPDGTSKLTVSTKDGADYRRPQTILDQLLGSLTFDPLAFANMGRVDQLATLKRMLGLDFSDLDRDRDALLERRRESNREVKRLAGVLSDLAEPDPELPANEIDVQALLADLSSASDTNADNRVVRDRAAQARGQVDQVTVELTKLREQAEALARRIEEAEALRVKRDRHAGEEAQKAEAAQDRDIRQIQQALTDADQKNRLIREASRRRDVASELDGAKHESDDLSTQLDEIEREKRQQIGSAAFPVPGLSFSDDTVLFNGIPFDQASQAERLKVSIAMGFELNPRLRVLLVRDASVLDDASLALVSQLAEKYDGQVWLERVSDRDPEAIVIEAGQVRTDSF